MAITDNCELYYSLDDADLTGSNPDDLSGNGNNGTSSSITTGATGLLSECFDFNGTSSQIDTGTATFDTPNGSVSCWINVNSISDRGIISDRVSTNYFQLILTSSGAINFRINNGSNYEINTASNTITAGTWYHIVATWGSNGMKLYINNGTPGTNAYTGTWSTTNNMKIGQLVSFYWFDGKIDEVGIWSRELTSTEISELYNSGSGYNPYASTPPVSTTINNLFQFNDL